MRIVVFSGMTHTGSLALAALREADPAGKIIVVEPTIEKSAAAKKQYPWAEVLRKGIDEFIEYLRENSELIDVFVACSDSDATNYRFCKTAVDVGVPVVIPVLNNPMNRELFQRSGVTMVVDPYSSIRPKLLEVLKASGELLLYENMHGRVVLQAYKPPSKVKLKPPESGELILLAAKDNGTIIREPRELNEKEILYVLGVKDAVRKYLEGLRASRGKRASG